MSAHRVFISYSHKDSDWVSEFAHALEKQDVDVWFDRVKLLPGDHWKDALEKGLRESDAIVLLLSSDNAANPQIFFELGVDQQLEPSEIPL